MKKYLLISGLVFLILLVNVFADTINIDFYSPINGKIYNTTKILLNFSVQGDNNVSFVGYSVDNGSFTYFGPYNTPVVNFSQILTLEEGRHIIEIFMNDTDGTTVTKSRSFTVDITPPNITVYLPNGSYNRNESLPLNFTVNDSLTNISMCWFSVDNESNIIIANCQNTTFNVSGDGDHNLTLYANDSAGNINSQTVYFSTDTIAPNITDVSSTPSCVEVNQNITFSWYQDDNINISVSYCNFTDPDGTTYKIDAENGTGYRSCSKNVTEAGYWSIKIYVEDVGGNQKTYTTSFKVESKGGCQGVGGGGGVPYAPEEPELPPPPQPTCQDDPTLCATEEECLSAGWYWYDNSCHSQPSTIATCENDPSLCKTQDECLSAGWYWYGNACHFVQGTEESITVYPHQLNFHIYPEKLCDEKNITITWLDGNREFVYSWVSPDIIKYVKYPTLDTKFVIEPHKPINLTIKVCGIEDEFNYISDVEKHMGDISFFIEKEGMRIQDTFLNIINIYREPPSKCVEDPKYCTTKEECEDAGWYWYDDSCHSEPKPVAPPAPPKPKRVPITYIIIGFIIVLIIYTLTRIFK